MHIRPSHTRYLLLPLLLVLLFIAYLYFNSRPDYALYNSLSSLELATSRQLIADVPSVKYVLFKQLQGAGFNNQVSLKHTNLASVIIGTPCLGSRDYLVSPLSLTIFSNICLPALCLAASR
jgi:hypothetical protein